MNVAPSLIQLIGFLLVPVQVKVAFVMGLKHAITDESGFVQFILHIVEHVLLFINLCPPLLQLEGRIFTQNGQQHPNVFEIKNMHHLEYGNDCFNRVKVRVDRIFLIEFGFVGLHQRLCTLAILHHQTHSLQSATNVKYDMNIYV